MKRLSGAIPEHIAQRIAGLRALDAALRECLPADCAAHCQAAGITDGTLHIVADSSAWRARLHFHSGTIIRQIRSLGNFPVSRVRIRVARPRDAGTARRSPATHAGIPQDAARGLSALARDTEDPALRAVLERLARNGRGG